MPYSQNGYSANDVNLTEIYTIPGTEREIRLRKGPAGALLAWLAGQFDDRVEDIEAGQLDDWGYAERPIRGSDELSNHASGTAIDLNAVKHPLGAVGTFTVPQRRAIRRILGEAGFCIRWGGDYSGRKDEMHFEIVANESACRRVLARLEREDDDMQLSDKVELTGWTAEQMGVDPGTKMTVGGLLQYAAGGGFHNAEDVDRLRTELAKANSKITALAKAVADVAAMLKAHADAS